MISEINEIDTLENLSFSDVYEGKIKTLFRSYGNKYDFCKFLKQDEGLVLSKLDRDFVISQSGDEINAEELAEYLKANRAFSVFLPEKTLQAIEPFISGESLYNNLMEFTGEFYDDAFFNENPCLDDVYEILRHDFNIIHETWLTDVSHRVRHGISKAVLYNNVSTVTVLYDEDNTVFLTQVATLASARGQGAATKMLRSLAENYKGKRILLVCRNTMLGFYEKVGFKKIGSAAQIYRLDF